MKKQTNSMLKKLENLSDLEKQIILESLTEFENKGFHEASIDQIAMRLKIGKGTIYRHFGNKVELYVAIIVYLIDELEKSFFAITNAKTFKDFFDLYINSMIDFAASRGNFVMKFFMDSNRFANRDFIDKNPKVREIFHYIMNKRELGIEFLEKILELGKKENHIEPDIAVNACAEMIFVLINNYLINTMGMNQMKIALGIAQKYPYEVGVTEMKKTLYRAVGYRE